MVDYRNPGDETQALVLAKYLPSGRLWNSKYTRERVLGRLVHAFAKEIGRLFDFIEKFVNIELDPQKANDLLLEWEKSVQIPDRCFGRPETLQERRLRIFQKLSNFDDIVTLEDFQEFISGFGFIVEFVQGNETAGERLGFGLPPYTTQELKEIRHTLAVRVESEADVFPLDFPIPFSSASSSLLTCLVNRIAPANIAVQFFFGEDLGQPFVAPDTEAPISPAFVSRTAQGVTFTEQPNLALPEATRSSGSSGAVTLEGSVIAPGDITGLELDLTAKIPSISDWQDQSGIVTPNDVVQATLVRQPSISSINGNASLFFDGDTNTADSDLMRNNAANITSPPATIAIVFTPTSISAGLHDIFKFRSGFDEIFTIQRNGADLEVVEGQGGGASIMSVANVLTVGETRWLIARIRNSGDGLSDMLTDEADSDTVSAAAAISATIDDINIGANANGADAFAGHIHQCLYWNNFVSDTERDDIAAYLNAEWNLA